MIYQPIITGDVPYSVFSCKNVSCRVPHKHLDIELIYIVEGSVDVLLDEKLYKAECGDLVFVGSMVTHELIRNDSENKILVAGFGTALLNKFFSDISSIQLKNPIIRKLSDIDKIKKLLDEIVAELEVRDINSDLLISGNLYKIVYYLHKNLLVKSSVAPKKRQIKSQMMVNNALELIQHNYGEDITVEYAASLACYSVSSFCRIFKLAVGMSFHNYLNKVRIKNACNLLTDTTMSIGEISRRVGFSSTKTFCRIFKEVNGISASEYRKI